VPGNEAAQWGQGTDQGVAVVGVDLVVEGEGRAAAM
jgi:hypothetical protein